MRKYKMNYNKPTSLKSANPSTYACIEDSPVVHKYATYFDGIALFRDVKAASLPLC